MSRREAMVSTQEDRVLATLYHHHPSKTLTGVCLCGEPTPTNDAVARHISREVVAALHGTPQPPAGPYRITREHEGSAGAVMEHRRMHEGLCQDCLDYLDEKEQA